MTKKKQQGTGSAAPKGADLEKVDVWLRVQDKRRLEEIAVQENRSTTKQAVHFIERGMDGTSLSELARKIDKLEAMLAETLKRLDGK